MCFKENIIKVQLKCKIVSIEGEEVCSSIYYSIYIKLCVHVWIS